MGQSSQISFALTEPGPGTVRLSELARLIGVVEETGLLGSTPKRIHLECRFGDRYDADIDSIVELVSERPDVPELLTPQWMPMDMEEHAAADALAARFAQDHRVVSRAWVRFGSLPMDLRRRWTVENPGDLHYFRPESLSFNVDPWTAGSDEQNADVVLGFLSLSIHGDGGFFPRTAGDYIESIRSYPAIVALTRACEEIWPAIPKPANAELMEIRGCMRTNWPHPLDASTGWYWMG